MRLGSERVELGDDIERALAAQHDVLHERAAPGRLVHAGGVNPAFPVVADQRVDKRRLARRVRALDGNDGAVTDRHDASQQL